MKISKKMITWTGIISTGLATIGLPIFLIGGTGQQVSNSTVEANTYTGNYKYTIGEGESAKEETLTFETKVNPSGQEKVFITETSPPTANQTVIDQANSDIEGRIQTINDNYTIVKDNVSSSGFFHTKPLSADVNAAIDNIGNQLRYIRDNWFANGVEPKPEERTPYSLSASLFDIQQQLKLVVRVDAQGEQVNNVLAKNIQDNQNLAISGILFFVVGAIGLTASIVGYAMFKNNLK